ncbi:hypothetical protein AOC05_08195 [Arthrobacter alpinus]|uniref:Transketolase signature 1 domain-containing protein n=1 Tax=Arthrobacter alpinus TaxID=656366 RepID=A0A0M5M1Q6_9MICC|nr:hypothetical protein [Arthrobacter alpinus]ALE92312.1 hypothetical protein AOC05_08195 [Arthrobacter alpinus]
MNADQLELNRRLNGQLRVDSIRCSTSAVSGHPTSSWSAADLIAVLLLAGRLSSQYQAFGIASAGKYLGRITHGVWLRRDEPAVLFPALGI